MNKTKDLKNDKSLPKTKNKISFEIKQHFKPKNHQLIVVESSADT